MKSNFDYFSLTLICLRVRSNLLFIRNVSCLLASTTADKNIDNHFISIWRLATNQGKMLDSISPKLIRVLEKIEKYARKQSGSNFYIVEEQTENIEEEK